MVGREFSIIELTRLLDLRQRFSCSNIVHCQDEILQLGIQSSKAAQREQVDLVGVEIEFFDVG